MISRELIDKNMISKELFIKITSKHKNLDLEYYKKVEELKKYSYKFFNEIIEKYFPYVDNEILPIQFNPFSKKNIGKLSFENKNDIILGQYLFASNKQKPDMSSAKQHIINIYYVYYLIKNNLFETIRHEILHYCLNINDLKYDDDSAIFHILSKVYDFNVYKKLNEEEQKIYDIFLNIYNDYHLTNKNLQDLIMILGDKNITIKKIQNEVEKLKENNLKGAIKCN